MALLVVIADSDSMHFRYEKIAPKSPIAGCLRSLQGHSYNLNSKDWPFSYCV